ncbi:hypothetical protein SAMN05518672_1011232 [Chitinophaga sp. CF118]|uniref:hypothetical protein n=1 Tax=Chitinophaga sp. CF118 TaxID=1884367 RepID=UPI0008EC8C74|nr:hypothetical protein [Chitinophaga sp. CF118]SFD24424.1 hypothetical protein SAMN05518672_1011232 [Chitinophaga sp. CF118]
MTFSFKIFRALTSINLFFSGFFLMMLLMTLLSGAVQVLIFLVLLGAVFIHAILSLYLQKSLLDKSMSLKESTPGGIYIMGGVALIYAGILLVSCIVFVSNHDMVMAEMAKQLKQLPEDQQQQVTPGMINSMMNAIMAFLGFFGVIIVANILLSFNFLKQWKDRENTTDIDINTES